VGRFRCCSDYLDRRNQQSGKGAAVIDGPIDRRIAARALEPKLSGDALKLEVRLHDEFPEATIRLRETRRLIRAEVHGVHPPPAARRPPPSPPSLAKGKGSIMAACAGRFRSSDRKETLDGKALE
jgi:hypothetical protein